MTETLETFVFSLTSLFACQERFRDSDTSLSDDEDSTPKTLKLGEKGSIGRFWKDCGRQFYMLYLFDFEDLNLMHRFKDVYYTLRLDPIFKF